MAIVLAVLLAACAPRPVEAPRDETPADTLAAQPFGPVFEDARALGSDPAGRLYVVDAGAATVVTLTAEGLPLGILGGPGTGDYALLDPSDVDPTNGLRLDIADTGNARIQRFSSDGRLVASLPVPSDLRDGDARQRDLRDSPTTDRGAGQGRPVAVATAVSGEVYAVEEVQGLVVRWDDQRRFDRVVGGLDAGEGALSQPVDLALGPDGRLFVADRGHAAVLVYDRFGLYLRRIADGTARDLRAVAVVGDRLVLVLPRRLLDTLAVALPEPLVDVAGSEGRLVLLTATRLYDAGPLP
jgi:hypothetical protein